jgi:phosphoribosylformylglycinamidine synthase
MILGSSTGRDGIHGASLLASREFDEKTEDMRPTVQVGDPFAEKLLLEATLELIDAGVIVGIQDMGAAGISCSTSEMSARNGLGMNINLDIVPLREQGMSAYEIMLSESQERMLAVIEKGKEQIAIDICNKWDVPITEIGEVTDDGLIHIYRKGQKICELNADSLVLGGGAPQYDREAIEPSYLAKKHQYNCDKVAAMTPMEGDFRTVISSPNIASKRWIYEQYDSQVRTNTVSIKGDAAVIRLKELPGKAIAVTTDCNSRYVYLNPYKGAMIAVAEAARNVVCVGAEPVAITNCLNFGNPYDPEVYWQFSEAIKGMGDACRQLNTPVTGGNVSFHNESKNNAVFPTPTIGMLGIIDDLNKIMSHNFKQKDETIVVLGKNLNELGGSEYLKHYSDEVTGNAPDIDMVTEIALQKLALELIRGGLITSAHDISEGGLIVALAEMAISSGNIGCEIDLGDSPTVGDLFSETQSRIVITIEKSKLEQVTSIAQKHNVPFNIIGKTIEDKFTIKNYINYSIKNVSDLYENAIPNLMKL